MKAFYALSPKGKVSLDFILESLVNNDEFAIKCLVNKESHTRMILEDLVKEVAELKIDFQGDK